MLLCEEHKKALSRPGGQASTTIICPECGDSFVSRLGPDYKRCDKCAFAKKKCQLCDEKSGGLLT